MDGRVIWNQVVEKGPARSISLPGGNLNGLYLLRLNNREFNASQKVVIR
jgi:hypothetical protein